MIEIAIQEGWQNGFATEIYITNKMPDVRSFLQPDGNWVAVPVEEQMRRDGVKPTCRLPMEMGRELLEALMRHYHGADDARMLRKDYDAERARVDKILDALVEGQLRAQS